MDNDTLIELIRERIKNPANRTDWSTEGGIALAPPATHEQVALTEEALGFALHPLHRRLLAEIGNGGFGPANGLIGLPGGRLDSQGRSVIGLRRMLFTDASRDEAPLVPLWDWGDGTWACLDEVSERLIIVDEVDVTDTNVSLSDCMAGWATGQDLTQRFFTFKESTGINPFTRQPMTARLRCRPLGLPYIGRSTKKPLDPGS